MNERRSARADDPRLSAGTKLECKICWWVYDPAEGDPRRQVAAGTAFSELPEDWCCPQCDAPAEQFLVLP